MPENARLTGERPQEGVTPDSLLTLHAAGYRAMRERLDAGPLLDVGCGQGFESISLVAEDRPVVGVDYSAEAVTFARGQFSGRGLSVAQMDAFDLGIADGSFTSVCSSVLGCGGRAVRRWAAVVRVGGRRGNRVPPRSARRAPPTVGGS